MEFNLCVIALVILGIICFVAGIKCMQLAHQEEVRQDQIIEQIAVLKRKVETADFMKVNGVISQEEYDKEIRSICEEVDILEEKVWQE